MDYRILGPLEVRDGGRLVGLGGGKQRALLAILALHRNEVVSTDALIEDLWGESPPASALRTLQAYVSRLRKELDGNGAPRAPVGDSAAGSADGVLLTRGHGYLLRLAPGELDLERFRELAERGRDALAAGKPEEGARVLREALGLWRGPPLADFTYEAFAQAAIAQLEELHLAAVEERLEADLALGRARELVGELRDLVQRHPSRERLGGQLMLALYRSGRQTEALEVYQEFRRALSQQLGLDPGPGLQQLELAILNQDPTLDLSAGTASPGEPIGAPPAPLHTPARIAPLRLALMVTGAVLTLVVVGVLVASSGGRPSPPAIPGDSVGALSPAAGSIRAVVPLGTAPSAVVAGDGAVWVANSNAGTVSRIDPETRSDVETIPVGTAPSGLAVGGRGGVGRQQR
jgi:YVTN family beta-propeller protein